MKDLSLLVFLSQLGLSVVLPLGGFVLLAAWLRQRFELGVWIVILVVVIGLIVAAQGLVNMLKTMDSIAKEKKESPLSYNEHD